MRNERNELQEEISCLRQSKSELAAALDFEKVASAHGPTRGWGQTIAVLRNSLCLYMLKDLTKVALRVFANVSPLDITYQPSFTELPEFKALETTYKTHRFFNNTGFERQPSLEEQQDIIDSIIEAVKQDVQGNLNTWW